MWLHKIYRQDFFRPMEADSKLCMKIKAQKYNLKIFRVEKSKERIPALPDIIYK